MQEDNISLYACNCAASLLFDDLVRTIEPVDASPLSLF